MTNREILYALIDYYCEGGKRSQVEFAKKLGIRQIPSGDAVEIARQPAARHVGANERIPQQSLQYRVGNETAQPEAYVPCMMSVRHSLRQSPTAALKAGAQLVEAEAQRAQRIQLALPVGVASRFVAGISSSGVFPCLFGSGFSVCAGHLLWCQLPVGRNA